MTIADTGFEVSIPRLPGHGTNGGDFLQTGWRDWLRTSVDAYLELAAFHPRVHLVRARIGSTVLDRVVFPDSVHQTPAGADRGPAADAIVRWLTGPLTPDTVRA